MKNLFSLLKTAFLGLLPFLLATKYVVTAGGVIHVDFPPLGTLFTSLPAFASTFLTWYELLVRFVPTSGNYSLLSFLYRVIQSIAPNHAADDVPASELVLSGAGGVDSHA